MEYFFQWFLQDFARCNNRLTAREVEIRAFYTVGLQELNTKTTLTGCLDKISQGQHLKLGPQSQANICSKN